MNISENRLRKIIREEVLAESSIESIRSAAHEARELLAGLREARAAGDTEAVTSFLWELEQFATGGGLERWALGRGLLQVEAADEWLRTHGRAPTASVRFAVRASVHGARAARDELHASRRAKKGRAR